MGIVEKSLDASMERLRACLAECDYVGANLSCLKIAAHSKDDLGLALVMGLEQAVDSIFARHLYGEAEIDFESRLGSVLPIYDCCLLAVSLAIGHGVSGAVKNEAMMSARSLAGAAAEYERLDARDYAEMSDLNVDHGQRQFIFSICLAKALLAAGDGLIHAELREFATHFKAWIPPEGKGFSDAADILFQGQAEDAACLFCFEDNWDVDSSFTGFMAAMRAAMTAKEIESAIGSSSDNPCTDIPRLKKRVL